MLKPEKYKLPQRFGLDFSPSQHIVAVCIFLIQALVMFCLGVLVGKYQPSSFYAAQEKAVPVAGVERSGAGQPGQPGTRVSELPAPVPVSPVAKQLPRKPVVAPGPAPAEKDASLPQPDIPEKTAGEIVQPASVPIPKSDATPPPAPDAKAAETPAVPADKTGEPAADRTPVHPLTAKPARTKPAGEVKTTTTEEEKAALAEPPKSAAVPDSAKVSPEPLPAAADPAAKRGRYVIQLISYSGPDKMKNAETYVRRLQENAGMKAEILGTGADKFVRVVTGDFADHDSAMKACKELQQRSGFAGCFVRPR